MSEVPEQPSPSRKRKVGKMYHEYEKSTLFNNIAMNPDYLKSIWPWSDSPLDDGPDLKVRSFRRSFDGVLPKGIESLRGYIESLLEAKRGTAVFIEFGGPARQIAKDFTPGFFDRSFGVTLVDEAKTNTSEEVHARVDAADQTLNHTVIEADLLHASTYDDLRRRLDGRKAALIIERLGKGSDFAPEDMRTTGAVLKTWYEFLDDEGVMLLQIPVRYNGFLEAFVAHVEKTCGNTIEIRGYVGDYNGQHGENSSLFIRKRPGAPATLPMLDAETVSRIMKRNGST